MQNNYNKLFFDSFCGEDYSNTEAWKNHFSNIAEKIIEFFNPKSVLDAGCANGYLVEQLRLRGVEAYGVDISEYAISSAPSEIKDYLYVQSLTEPLPAHFPKKYDLVVSIEVLEHMFPDDGALAIKRLCEYSDTVLFSSTPFDVDNKTHVNVQQMEYWAKIFAENSFYHNQIHSTEFLTPWAMLFNKADDVPTVIFNYELSRRVDKLREDTPTFTGKIYFDCGDGYSEENSATFDFKGGVIKTDKIPIPTGCRALRIDPCENYFSIISDFIITTNAGFLKPDFTNASCLIDSTYYFTNTDPQIHFNFGEVVNIWLEISGKIFMVENAADYLPVSKIIERLELVNKFEAISGELTQTNNRLSLENSALVEKTKRYELENADCKAKIDEQAAKLLENEATLGELFDIKEKCKKLENEISLLEEELSSLKGKDGLCEKLENEISILARNNEVALEEYEKARRELEYYKSNYCAAQNQLGEWKNHAENLQGMYDNVASSFFWKISKPIRWMLDLTKAILRKIKPIRLFFKFFKCWRENGFKYTMRKLRDRKKYAENAARPLYTKEELMAQKTHKFSRDIKISILVPLYNTPISFLKEMIGSVTDQTYQNWELCLADGSNKKEKKIRKFCEKLAHQDSRIVYKKLEKNLGISENTNACIDISSGDYIALFDHDDILHPAALYNVMEAICDKGADYIYTDEATFESPNISKISTIHYKPDFAPDNLRANNYICHLSVFSRELLDKAGKFRKSYDGSQDHDIILRLTANAKKIVHIPKVLYFWRSHPMSVAMDINSKTYAITAGKNAVHTSITECGIPGSVESTKVFPAMYKVSYNIASHDRVSIIIANPKLDIQFVNSINAVKAKTKYTDYEIIVPYDTEKTSLDVINKLDRLASGNIIRKIALEGATPAELINTAAKAAKGKYLAILDGAGCVANEDWIVELLMYAQRDDVGIAGGSVYFMDNTFKHAGYVVGHGDEKFVQSLFFGVHNSSVGYMGRLWYAQNLSAVSCELLMIRKELFFKLGGLDNSLSYHYDVDLCLNARADGKLVVWTPYSSLYSEFESLVTLADDKEREAGDITLLKTKWAKQLVAGDPYYNPNFAKERVDFTL